MKKILVSLVFLSGYLIMSLEILGGRILAPFFGNSVHVWGSLIGVILIALAGGYYLGGWLAELNQNKEKQRGGSFFLGKLFFWPLFFYYSIFSSICQF